MALLFFDGFEAGHGTAHSEWVLGTITHNSATVRTGNYSMQGNSGAGTQLLLPPSAQITCGFAIWDNTPNQTEVPFSIYADGNTVAHLTLLHNASSQFELRRGTSGGALLATSTATMPSQQWRHLQIKATIHDTTGICEVKLDGVTIINYTGDTRNAGTSTNIDALRFIMTGGTAMFIDDLWVCDGTSGVTAQGRAYNDFLGDLKVAAMLPNAAGDLTQFTPSTAPNWSCVDDPTLNTTDYVTSSATAQQDLYNYANIPTGAQAVYGVRVSSYAAKTDAGLYGVKHLVKENGVLTAEPTPNPLSTTFSSYDGPTYYKRPSDNGLWVLADVNALQAGVEAVAM